VARSRPAVKTPVRREMGAGQPAGHGRGAQHRGDREGEKKKKQKQAKERGIYRRERGAAAVAGGRRSTAPRRESGRGEGGHGTERERGKGVKNERGKRRTAVRRTQKSRPTHGRASRHGRPCVLLGEW